MAPLLRGLEIVAMVAAVAAAFQLLVRSGYARRAARTSSGTAVATFVGGVMWTTLLGPWYATPPLARLSILRDGIRIGPSIWPLRLFIPLLEFPRASIVSISGEPARGVRGSRVQFDLERGAVQFAGSTVPEIVEAIQRAWQEDITLE